MSDKIQLFGRSYNQYGDSNADVIIKTKGQVKIQWGSKFIDLIKDGKIAVDSSFIFKVQDVSKIGVKDGIYVVGGEAVYLKVGDSTINLIGEVGDTFVSFMEGQETTSEAKYNAMVNIGFIYKSLDEVNDTSLQNGVIYIESEQKLFFVKDGTLSEFKVNIPSPFTEPFIIQKADDSKGALVIKGTGSANSVAFDSFWIYTEYDNGVIDATNGIVIKVGESDKVTIDSSSVKVDADLITSMIKSPSATADSGFRLYYMNNESVLEVDRIVERGSQQGTDDNPSIVVYPEYWLLNNRIIKDATPHDDTPEDTEQEGTSQPTNILDLTLFQECTYKVGDILCAYKQQDIEEDTGQKDEEGLPITNTISSYARVELEVTSVSDDGKEIQVKCSDTLDEDTINNFVGRFIFLIKPADNKAPIRLKSNTIDIVEYGDKSGDTRSESVKTRIGDLSSLKDGETALEGYGIYTNHLILGGTEEKHFPKYTETLNALVSALNIKDSDTYNCVLVSVGLLKEVLKENQETIDELKQKVETMEADIATIKQQLEQQTTE